MCCLCFRCPDTSVQSILCDLWDGTEPGGPLRFLLLLTQPGVSGMCWPCLWLSLRSSCLRRLQGKWSIAPSFYYCRAKMSSFSVIALIKKYYLEAIVCPLWLYECVTRLSPKWTTNVPVNVGMTAIHSHSARAVPCCLPWCQWLRTKKHFKVYQYKVDNMQFSCKFSCKKKNSRQLQLSYHYLTEKLTFFF